MNHIDLAGIDVVVHHTLRRGSEQLFARRALEVTEDFHGDGSALRAEGFARINVAYAVHGDGAGGNFGGLGCGRGLCRDRRFLCRLGLLAGGSSDQK